MAKPIALAADHGGFELKEAVKAHLDELGLEYIDFGTHSTASVDYPDMALPACDAVVSGQCSKALLFCGCLLYTSPSPRDGLLSRMPSSA